MIDTRYHQLDLNPPSLSTSPLSPPRPSLLRLTCVYNLDSHYSEITRSNFYLKPLNARTSSRSLYYCQMKGLVELVLCVGIIESSDVQLSVVILDIIDL